MTVKVRDDYGGCRWWLEITRDLPFEGTPVLSDEELERASQGRGHRRVRRRPRLRLSADELAAQPPAAEAGAGRSPQSWRPWPGRRPHPTRSWSATRTATRADVGAVLGQLEHARDRFDERFPASPGELVVVPAPVPPRCSTPRRPRSRCSGG